MKVIAALLNIALLVFVVYEFTENGFPSSSSDKLIVSLIVFSPIANLWCIFFSKISSSNNFIALYFKRKSLEEKMKIEALQRSKDNE
jgi:hypothetical protein